VLAGKQQPAAAAGIAAAGSTLSSVAAREELQVAAAVLSVSFKLVHVQTRLTVNRADVLYARTCCMLLSAICVYIIDQLILESSVLLAQFSM
jgi:hypothetical protein